MNNDKPWDLFIDEHLEDFLAGLTDTEWVLSAPATLSKSRLLGVGESKGLSIMRKVIKSAPMRRFELKFNNYLQNYEDALWTQYLSKHLKKFLSAIPNSEYCIESTMLSDIEIEGWYSKAPKDLYRVLRIWIPQKYVKKFQNRYRAHKHRDVRNIEQFEISAKSKAILDRYKDKIEAGSLDEAIERCFAINYNTKLDFESEHAKAHVANRAEFSNTVFFSDLVERLTRSDCQKLALIIERSFKAGWQAAKTSRVKNGDPKQDAFEQFDYKIILSKFTNIDVD